MTLLLITVQRNKTVREIKFSQFIKSDKICTLNLYVSKTNTNLEINIHKDIVALVEKIKKARLTGIEERKKFIK
jgi:hypothetical protein